MPGERSQPLSFWHESLSAPSRVPRAPLVIDDRVDVAIVGAGYSGLWTAYYLKLLDPGLRVAVVEAEVAGFGASGRNGGWCVGRMAGLDLEAGDDTAREGAMRLQRACFDSVYEVGRVCEKEGIDAQFARGGTIGLAMGSAQAERLKREAESFQRLGFGDTDIRWLDAESCRNRVAAEGAEGGLLFEHCAALHPARLVFGLAETVERQGTRIYEGSRVVRVEAGELVTDRARLSAGCVVIATEGYTTRLPGYARSMIPMHSMMVATEPLSEETWREIGLKRRETFGDGRRIVIYGQRTADGRLAFGGRGLYLFGSRVRDRFSPSDPGFVRVERTLRSLFPVLRDTKITHRWGGALGIARDWRPRVVLDRGRGIARLGSYAGEGVAASNLAGRTLAEAILERTTERTGLPLVDDGFPTWEPEPLRWAAVRGLRTIGDRLDRRELEGLPTPRWARWLFDAFVRN